MLLLLELYLTMLKKMIEIGGNASIRARKVIDMLEKEVPNDFLEMLKKKTCDWR